MIDSTLRNELNKIKNDILELQSSERARKLIRTDTVNCPKCNKKGKQDLAHISQYQCENSFCSVLEFVNDELEPRVTIDEAEW